MTNQLNSRRDASCVLAIAVFLAAPAIALADAVPHAETTDFMHARYYSPNLGRFLSVDPVGGTVGSSQSWNRYSYVLNNPVGLVDPDGRAPNRAGTTDPATILTEVRNLERAAGGAGASQRAVLDTLSANHGSNTDRYFYTQKHGWVDVRHFGAAASFAMEYGETATKAAGFGVEVDQAMNEGPGDYHSAFSSEDLSSNAAGADFGANYLDGNVSLEVGLTMWLDDAGALPLTDPEAGAERNNLPGTDPSDPASPDAGKGTKKMTSKTPKDKKVTGK